jgi:hypothetical protein
MNPDMLLGHMRDIRELDDVAWWPLATGWWLLVAVIAMAVLLVHFGRAPFTRWRRRRAERWRRDAARQLAELERQLGTLGPKAAAAHLSELLRRIAVARCGREACAGLEGERWLAFLAANDPKRFPWPDHRKLLLQAPYAPPAAFAGKAIVEEMKSLVRAARAWTQEASTQAEPAAGTSGGSHGV